jgi:hypothetical protein
MSLRSLRAIAELVALPRHAWAATGLGLLSAKPMSVPAAEARQVSTIPETTGISVMRDIANLCYGPLAACTPWDMRVPASLPRFCLVLKAGCAGKPSHP